MPRTDLVSLYLPITAYGHAVAEAEVNVRPVWDHACPGNVGGITADVFIFDHEGSERAVSTEDGATILARIKSEMPDVWREIEEKADEEHREAA